MIIISKFHDYYDSGMTYGIDKELRFIRKTEKIDKQLEIPEKITELMKDLPKVYDYYRSQQFTAQPFIIIFCGQVHLGYHFFNLKDPKDKNYYVRHTDPDIYTYDLPSVEKVIQKYEPEMFKTFRNKDTLFHRILPSFKYDVLERAFKKFEDKKMDVGIHLDEESPILYLGYDDRDFIYIKNPVLRKLQFFKKVNSFTAFQNISMFIGGICSKTFPPTVELSEKDRIGKQGFDKWSFRKKGENSK